MSIETLAAELKEIFGDRLKMVAAFGEAIIFADKNPAKAKAAISKVMRVKEEEALQVAYNVYTKDIVDRRMIVPSTASTAAGRPLPARQSRARVPTGSSRRRGQSTRRRRARTPHRWHTTTGGRYSPSGAGGMTDRGHER